MMYRPRPYRENKIFRVLPLLHMVYGSDSTRLAIISDLQSRNSYSLFRYLIVFLSLSYFSNMLSRNEFSKIYLNSVLSPWLTSKLLQGLSLT